MATFNKRLAKLSGDLDEVCRAYVKDEIARGSADPVGNPAIVQGVMAAYAMAIGRLLAVKGRYKADTSEDVEAFGRMLAYSIGTWRQTYLDDQASADGSQIVTASEILQ